MSIARWLTHAVGCAVLCSGLTSFPGHAVAATVTLAQDLGVLATTATLNFGSSFNDLAPAQAGIQIRPQGVAINLAAGEVFHEQYRFSLGSATQASVLGLTIDLGNLFNIDDLALRLFAQPAADLGGLGGVWPQAGVAPLAQSLAGAPGNSGESQEIALIQLSAGAYLLDVAGRVTGVSGGSYAGVLNLSTTAVSEPGGLSLSLLSLGMAAAVLRQRLRRGPQPT